MRAFSLSTTQPLRHASSEPVVDPQPLGQHPLRDNHVEFPFIVHRYYGDQHLHSPLGLIQASLRNLGTREAPKRWYFIYVRAESLANAFITQHECDQLADSYMILFYMEHTNK